MKDSARIRRAETAAQIKDAMDAAGLSRKEFAEKMDKSPSEVTRWLSGNHNFTSDLLAEISDALGRDITGVPDTKVREIVSGYATDQRTEAHPEYLHDPDVQYSIPMLTLPPSSYRNLQRLAAKAGLSVRRYAESVLSDESRKGEPRAADFCGILDEGFPTAEELRSLRSTSGIIEL
ncbi:MAG: helix-turn-helix domain-containing protein [Bacteroidales bacterium]|nr:helix-turn-helix domain-containing protein [Bacteroidales bacterium]